LVAEFIGKFLFGLLRLQSIGQLTFPGQYL
jgi:hypothetical protein